MQQLVVSKWLFRFKGCSLTFILPAILILRIYAMYGRNRWLLWTLSAMLSGVLISELAIIVPITVRMRSEYGALEVP